MLRSRYQNHQLNPHPLAKDPVLQWRPLVARNPKRAMCKLKPFPTHQRVGALNQSRQFCTLVTYRDNQQCGLPFLWPTEARMRQPSLPPPMLDRRRTLRHRKPSAHSTLGGSLSDAWIHCCKTHYSCPLCSPLFLFPLFTCHHSTIGRSLSDLSWYII